ncbi:hypothetical protein RRG08_038923 [Elysia crispata]|uniref:Uncharacterized protein n=1 Tax=Elysia crispata TaxID=231223 RepID=A0AAE0Y7V3_9GAST|nr:hypothetical protein RRG08_038923 [Elysia crispata]
MDLCLCYLWGIKLNSHHFLATPSFGLTYNPKLPGSTESDNSKAVLNYFRALEIFVAWTAAWSLENTSVRRVFVFKS